MTNLFKPSWRDLDPAEIKCILHELIGGPGQYEDHANHTSSFYLPLAGTTCQVTLTFSKSKELTAIQPGPAFNDARWTRVTEEIETTGPVIVGRDFSFSGSRVHGSWRGERSRVQILPPPTDAPVAPCEEAEHPFIIEFPVRKSDFGSITNFRRMQEHRNLTLLLNILLVGRISMQPRRSRQFWAIEPMHPQNSWEVKWVQEFFLGNLGEVVRDTLSELPAERMQEVDPGAYYTSVGRVGQLMRVPADLDDSIMCYRQLSARNREKFGRTSFWMDMASRQWTTSASASFASLVIAIEALGERATGPTARFHGFMEKYAPGASLQDRRRQMYDLRSDILHGSGLMRLDMEWYFGWDPPGEHERQLIYELWGLTRLAVRNWLKAPSPV
jgi:hypothetical protein